MIKNFQIILVSIFCCLTMPGLDENYSIYFGDYGVKLIAIVLLIFSIRKINNFIFYPFFRNIIILLIILSCYKVFNSVYTFSNYFFPFIITIWIIIIFLSINTNQDLRIFLFFIYIYSIIIVFSAGLENIFDLDKLTYSAIRKDNSLVGITNHYIEYSQVALMNFYLSIYYFRKSNNIFYKFIFTTMLFISFIAVFNSGSRGALISFIVSFFILFYLLNSKLNTKRKITFSIFFAFLLVSFYFLLDQFNAFSSLDVIGSNQDLSSIKRFGFIQFSTDAFLNNPIFGNGWGYVRNRLGNPPHSLPIQLLAELGIIGLLPEILIYRKVFLIFNNVKSKFNSNRNSFDPLIITIFLIAVSYGFWSFFENIGFVYGTRNMYVILAIFLSRYKVLHLKYS